MATTTHWLPNLSAASRINSGRSMAAEFTEILSAPSRSSFRKSSTVRIPPPTVNGMNTLAATFRTISTTVSRCSQEAVMSRNTTSSAPAASYAFAISTGSPASFRSTKLTPFTTRPLFTSRQGIIRFVNIIMPPSQTSQNSPVFSDRTCCSSPGGTGRQICCPFQRRHE